jgi:hypothetical protein
MQGASSHALDTELAKNYVASEMQASWGAKVQAEAAHFMNAHASEGSSAQDMTVGGVPCNASTITNWNQKVVVVGAGPPAVLRE